MKRKFSLIITGFLPAFLLGFNVFLNAQTVEEKQWIINGNNYYLNKDFDKARAEYIKVLTKSPSSLKANFNLGNTYYELKDYKKAVTHFLKASQSTTDKTEKGSAFHNLGNSYMQQQEYAKAVEAFKHSLRNNPKDNETRYNFALAKKLLDMQQKKQDPPDLPKPSVYALQMKAKADSLSANAAFKEALNTMNTALHRDSTVMHFRSYMDKLEEVVILDTIKLK